jgi:cytochrome c553
VLRLPLALLLLAFAATAPAQAADTFADKVKPFLTEYCVRCHTADKKSGELDLTKYDTSAKLLDDFRQWEHVVTFLKKEEMPPAAAKQPAAALRAEMVKAIEAVLHAEARRLGGDPGVVPPRRLTNAEYDNTIHDLTGADIRPAKAFPVDPASGEGFSNTGEALTVSPALFKKYLAAAEFVGEHAVLATDGLRFAPHPAVAFADRQKFYERQIIAFYEAHAVDHARYFTELWLYKHSPKPKAAAGAGAWAAKAGLSAKYAEALWGALEGPSDDTHFVVWLRQRWAAFPAPKSAAAPTAAEVQNAARSLAADAAKLGKEIAPKETEAIVANAGNGPIDHLARRRKTADARDTFDPAKLAKLSVSVPNLPDAGQPVPAAVAASGNAFCKLFPNRFFYVDGTRGLSAGFHLIEGFFRDDRPLCKSVLSDAENAELDRLWRELYFATGIWEKMLRGFVFFERSERNFLKHKDFDEFKEEDPDLTKDETLARFQATYLLRSNVKLTGEELAKHPISVFFTDVRTGLKGQAAALKAAEPLYLRDLLAFAERAYRRPLTADEKQKLEAFYAKVCADKDHGTEAAVRATVARVLVSPHVLMRFAPTPNGDTVSPLSDLALASRLSYFIWSGPPDAELLALAKAGKLSDDKTLREQVRRMVRDPKVSRFAQEFFGQWLGHRDFLTQEAVNRAAFPAFDDALKQAMFEEPTRLLTHLIQQDRPITEFLSGDGTFVNKKLAAHYGLPFNGAADEWQYVTGLRAAGRGGVMGMAVFLTKNSQPQRTSPVKRGFWVVHKLLGEHIPPPPPDVAVLPAKETDTGGKTVRELLKLHVSDAKCASCHQRFDPVGLAMEGFDPIGKSRAKDLAGRPVDTVVTLPDGKAAKGVPEFAAYLATARKAEFTKTLNQKFLGYALGRSLQLSDQPLLERMQSELDRSGDKLSVLFELVATSPQFRTQRCKDFSPAKFTSANPPGGPK